MRTDGEELEVNKIGVQSVDGVDALTETLTTTVTHSHGPSECLDWILNIESILPHLHTHTVLMLTVVWYLWFHSESRMNVSCETHDPLGCTRLFECDHRTSMSSMKVLVIHLRKSVNYYRNLRAERTTLGLSKRRLQVSTEYYSQQR